MTAACCSAHICIDTHNVVCNHGISFVSFLFLYGLWRNLLASQYDYIASHELRICFDDCLSTRNSCAPLIGKHSKTHPVEYCSNFDFIVLYHCTCIYECNKFSDS